VGVGVLSRENHERSIALPAGHGELTVLVEDQGGVDYGQRIGEPKGLIGPAWLDGDPVLDWTVTAIELDGIPDLAADAATAGSGPLVSTAEFALEGPADLFLDTSAWGKGYAWVNGFLLGRYWRRGPQQTLYVPAPVTRAVTVTLPF
jgi:beta-galactosidase